MVNWTLPSLISCPCVTITHYNSNITLKTKCLGNLFINCSVNIESSFVCHLKTENPQQVKIRWNRLSLHSSLSEVVGVGTSLEGSFTEYSDCRLSDRHPCS